MQIVGYINTSPAEGTHIHAAEQVRTQGIKKNSGQNNETRVKSF